jgi:hypothetical protein
LVELRAEIVVVALDAIGGKYTIGLGVTTVIGTKIVVIAAAVQGCMLAFVADGVAGVEGASDTVVARIGIADAFTTPTSIVDRARVSIVTDRSFFKVFNRALSGLRIAIAAAAQPTQVSALNFRSGAAHRGNSASIILGASMAIVA